MKNDVLSDVNAEFDLFTFPDDQFDSLNAAGVLSEVPNSSEISSRNNESASACATYNGKMYAYPYTADNGYFLYYNKAYFSDSDLQTLDGILNVCTANGKYMTMQMDSGWYLYSFFGQTGLNFSINDDGLTNSCDWNTGVVLVAVNNLVENANKLIAFLQEEILPEFDKFVTSSSDYKNKAEEIGIIANDFRSQASRLNASISEITGSITSITTSIEEGSNGVTTTAENIQGLATDMSNIEENMQQSSEVANALKESVSVFTV